ncbi:hypothetical protein [Methylobacterium nodulans]|uniref:Uncharacterized protein n=1 Tax=Methylobacterium nodulans (strain LMG 21967 / CNCM I-2342 / ORS 2060) TaxID=460265 RepID=B8IIN0_METNO|nr:hypothetical protein [Methylobacterium nodulans]ACL59907.1 hypothetical protein Mnod_5061 [Methylobacterium nodulans ORS 2060]
MARDRITPLQRDLQLLIDEGLSPEVQAQHLREFAHEEFQRAQFQNERALGYVPEHDLFVDGGQREDLSTVRASSRIIYEFHLLTDVIEWVDGMLQLHSPVLSGRYQASHQWFADDQPFDITQIPPAKAYVVLNTQPYARRIERGWSRQAPDGVYEGVAALAKRRFGNVAYVGFTFRSFPAGAIGAWAQSASAAQLAREVRGGNPKLHEEWLTRQPAIYIDPGRGG